MKKTLLLSFVLLLNLTSFSQNQKVEKGNEKYEKYAYIDAIEIYEKIASTGYRDEDMLKKLANSYYFNAYFQNAEKWYSILFNETNSAEPEYYYRYAQCLKANGNYTLAHEYLDKFSKENSEDSRAKRYIENSDYLDVIKQYSNRYTLEDSGISSEFTEYGGVFYEDEFIYTAAKDTRAVAKIRHSWSGQSFTNLYSAKISPNGTLIDSRLFSEKLNSKFHESSPVFTSDGKTVYFTRNNYFNGKKETNSKAIVLLKLYKADLVDGNWTNISELPFNSDEYNVAHPALSVDNKTLFFSSDMPGTKGLSDIYKVSINEDNTFGTPVNLGDLINTEGRETFPFVSNNNEFYFASDGHLGLGGLDVFALKINSDDSFSKIYNVGAPVNSSSDDFAFMIDAITRVGYFSSNRDGGQGYDDIYKLKEIEPLPFKSIQAIELVLIDKETSEIAPNASVVLMDENMNYIDETSNAENGKYHFDDLESSTKYYLKIQSEGFETVETPVITEDTKGITVINTEISRNSEHIAEGDNLIKVLSEKPIYFDLGKWNIKKDAGNDLLKIVEVMKQNPSLKIEVQSHTDSRQTMEYNLKLSNQRAKSTINWMIKKGINPDRLTGKGFGESKLLNKCSDGVECSEIEHQENRRSDFIISDI